MSVTRRINLPGNLPPITPDIIIWGDWQRSKHLLNTIDGVIMMASLKAKKSAAEKLKAAIRKNIRENGGSLGWPPLSTKYQAWKSRKGYDANRMLRMTGLYYRSINVWRKGLNYYVGVQRGIRNPASGGNITVGQIAKILEYGSDHVGIPARPLWGPTYKQFGGSARIRGLMVWHLRNEIYKHYGVRPRLTL